MTERADRPADAARPTRPTLEWIGPQLANHSLAVVNRELCRRLLAHDDLTLVCRSSGPDAPDVVADGRWDGVRAAMRRATAPGAIEVRHHWPPDFGPRRGGRLAVIQPWEFGALPSDWVRAMTAHVDEMWVPSSWLRSCYIDSGIPGHQVHVVPNGVDGTLFRPDGPRFPVRSRHSFRFLFVGGTIPRKGIDVLLAAYHAAFRSSDDVCLVIKGSLTDTLYRGSSLDAVLADLQSYPGAPAVEYLDADLPATDIAALYRSCDTLVHPFRGEGFGLPVAEAMASGLPVIVTAGGAADDFCDASVATLLPASRRTLPPRTGNLPPTDGPPYWWLEPDADALVELLRNTVGDPGAADRAEAARRRILEEFTWDGAAERVAARVAELVLPQGDRVAVDGVRRQRSAETGPGDAQPAVSIVIPSHHNLALTQQCLDAIERTATPGSYEIIVVDNGSTDATPAFLGDAQSAGRLAPYATTRISGSPAPATRGSTWRSASLSCS